MFRPVGVDAGTPLPETGPAKVSLAARRGMKLLLGVDGVIGGGDQDLL